MLPVTCTSYFLPLLQVVYYILCFDCYCLYIIMAKYGVGGARARQGYADHLQEVASVEGGETALVQ